MLYSCTHTATVGVEELIDSASTSVDENIEWMEGQAVQGSQLNWKICSTDPDKYDKLGHYFVLLRLFLLLVGVRRDRR